MQPMPISAANPPQGMMAGNPSQGMDESQDQSPDAQGDAQQGQAPKLNPKQRQILAASRIAITNPKFKEAFDQSLQQAKFPAACALIVMSLLAKGQEQVGDLDPEELYADGGVGDAVMAALFKWAETEGYPEAKDENAYDEALDILEQMGMEKEAQAGQGQSDQGGPQDAQATPQQPGVPAPVQGGPFG